MIVVDTNVVAYLFLESPHRKNSQGVRRFDSVWVVPPLWRSEFWNVLVMNVRHRRLAPELALEMAVEGDVFLGPCEVRVDFDRVLALATRSGCSAYDCEFVALAQDLQIPLVTADQQVLAAFPDTAVSMDSF